MTEEMLGMIKGVFLRFTVILLAVVISLAIFSSIGVVYGWVRLPADISLPLAIAMGSLKVLLVDGSLFLLLLGLFLTTYFMPELTPILSRVVDRRPMSVSARVYLSMWVASTLLLVTLNIDVSFLNILLRQSYPRIREISGIPLNPSAFGLGWILALASILFIGALLEESTFRLAGLTSIFLLLRKPVGEERAWWIAILASSTMFSVYHLIPGVNALAWIWLHAPITTLIRTFLSGFVLGWIYKAYGFEHAIATHWGSNLVSFVLATLVS